MEYRIPITRHDTDGTVVDGTALVRVDRPHVVVMDFRDLNGHELPLLAGSEYKIQLGDEEACEGW